MASSLPTAVELESLKELAECPICLEIPRNGLMLQCFNGHNVCATCKRKMNRLNNTKCPMCRCDYHDPPTRNSTVAGLVAICPFVFECKFANRSGCQFRGIEDVLSFHEREHRSGECPKCRKRISAARVIEHFVEKHELTEGVVHPDATIEERFFWTKDWASDSNGRDVFGWASVYNVSGVWAFPFAECRDGRVFLWLQMLAPPSAVKKLKCHISLRKGDLSASFTAPVYPCFAGMTAQNIVADGECASLSVDFARTLMTNEDIPEDFKECECQFELKVTFKIVKNAA